MGKTQHTIHQLDTSLASWYQDAPHLPVNGQKWLATNMWWLTLISVILGAIGALQVVAAMLFTGTIFGGILGGMYGGLILGGVALVTMTVTLLLAIASLVVSAAAVQPLRVLDEKGWRLLFIVLLISVFSTAFGFVISWSATSFLTGIIFSAIAGYFLYEIRPYFVKGARTAMS